MEESDHNPVLKFLPRLELITIAAYLLTLCLVVVPYYNWPYRVFVNFLHTLALLVSMLIFLVALVRGIVKFRSAKVIINLIFGVLIVYSGLSAHTWRYSITDRLIKDKYCDLNEAIESEYLLGGIKEIRLDNRPDRTGAFENSSSCFMVMCAEEFYFCSDAKMGANP